MYTLIITIIILFIILYIIYIIKNNLNNNIEHKTLPNINDSNTNNSLLIIDSSDSSKIMDENNNIDKFTNIKQNDIDDNIKMVIFVATWCGACNSYKNNIHNKLSEELKNRYKNIKFEFIVDDPENENIKNLQKYFEIKYFPTIFLYKNDKFKKLPMNDPITVENIENLIKEI